MSNPKYRPDWSVDSSSGDDKDRKEKESTGDRPANTQQNRSGGSGTMYGHEDKD